LLSTGDARVIARRIESPSVASMLLIPLELLAVIACIPLVILVLGTPIALAVKLVLVIAAWL
jgi:hypothetical protein